MKPIPPGTFTIRIPGFGGIHFHRNSTRADQKDGLKAFGSRWTWSVTKGWKNLRMRQAATKEILNGIPKEERGETDVREAPNWNWKNARLFTERGVEVDMEALNKAARAYGPNQHGGKKFVGIDPETGGPLYFDLKGNPVNPRDPNRDGLGYKTVIALPSARGQRPRQERVLDESNPVRPFPLKGPFSAKLDYGDQDPQSMMGAQQGWGWGTPAWGQNSMGQFGGPGYRPVAYDAYGQPYDPMAYGYANQGWPTGFGGMMPSGYGGGPPRYGGSGRGSADPPGESLEVAHEALDDPDDGMSLTIGGRGSLID